MDKINRVYRLDKINRVYRLDKINKAYRVDKINRVYRVDKINRVYRVDKINRVYKVDKINREYRVDCPSTECIELQNQQTVQSERPSTACTERTKSMEFTKRNVTPKEKKKEQKTPINHISIKRTFWLLFRLFVKSCFSIKRTLDITNEFPRSLSTS